MHCMAPTSLVPRPHPHFHGGVAWVHRFPQEQHYKIQSHVILLMPQGTVGSCAKYIIIYCFISNASNVTGYPVKQPDSLMHYPAEGGFPDASPDNFKTISLCKWETKAFHQANPTLICNTTSRQSSPLRSCSCAEQQSRYREYEDLVALHCLYSIYIL